MSSERRDPLVDPKAGDRLKVKSGDSFIFVTVLHVDAPGVYQQRMVKYGRQSKPGFTDLPTWRTLPGVLSYTLAEEREAADG